MARTVKQKHGGAVNRFEKGDPGGPGRTPLLASTVVKDLKAQGIDRVSRAEVEELIGLLQNLPREKLLEFVKDEANTPIVVALIARGLSGAKGHEFMSRDLWDRLHGKAKQSLDVKTTERVTVKFK